MKGSVTLAELTSVFAWFVRPPLMRMSPSSPRTTPGSGQGILKVLVEANDRLQNVRVQCRGAPIARVQINAGVVSLHCDRFRLPFREQLEIDLRGVVRLYRQAPGDWLKSRQRNSDFIVTIRHTGERVSPEIIGNCGNFVVCVEVL